ncbi:MAG: hypothetical protein ACRD3A_00800 [Terriglobales bacterium]
MQDPGEKRSQAVEFRQAQKKVPIAHLAGQGLDFGRLWLAGAGASE